MLRLIRLFGRREWALLGVALIFTVTGVWMDLSIPPYLGSITYIVTTGDGTIAEIWEQGSYMVAFAIGSLLTAVVVAWAGAMLSSGFSAKMRKAVYEQVGDFSNADVKKFSVSSLITRCTNDITQVRMFISIAILIMMRVPIIIVWAIMKMVDVSTELSIITAVAVGSIALMTILIVIIVLPRFKRIQENTDKLNLESRENLTGIRVVRAYNAENFEQKKFGRTNEALARDNLFLNRAMGVAMPFIMLVLSTLTVAIYWAASRMIDGGHVDIMAAQGFFADTVVFLQYSFLIVGSFIMMIMVFMMLPGALVSAKRINEVLKTKPTIVDDVKSNTSLNDAFSQDGTIRFNAVSYKYRGAEENVLSDVNIEIKRGQTAAFIGSTGCGKSTLVNLISRIADPTSGDVTIGGVNVRDVSLKELNDFVGYTPQTATLFGGTIKENVALGRAEGKDVSDEEIEKALKVAQAWDFVSELNEGINATVEQNGKNFSGGQKQRLSIARTVARQPRVFIFDDTFSALDYKTDRALRAELKKETKDATVIIVAQRIGTIRSADIIFVMERGRIVSAGKHEELLKTCEVYKQIARSQLGEEELRS